MGISLNFHAVRYEKISLFDESGYDPASAIQFANFDNLLHTEGSGFSFALGTIAKLNENVRLGASYQSPTWYRLQDDTSQRIDSDLADTDIGFIDFNIVNLFEPYTVKTPAIYTGSLAVIFGKNGLLSFDYSYQDMSRAELRPTNDLAFSTVNYDIRNSLTGVSAFRLGGEYRIERVSLRGGYRFEGSPYKDGQTIGDLNGFSAGIGYQFGPSRLDLSYNRTERDLNARLFDIGFNTPARVNNVHNNVSLAYTLNF
jgi:long-subunit fatty acid transport protein